MASCPSNLLATDFYQTTGRILGGKEVDIAAAIGRAVHSLRKATRLRAPAGRQAATAAMACIAAVTPATTTSSRKMAIGIVIMVDHTAMGFGCVAPDSPKGSPLAVPTVMPAAARTRMTMAEGLAPLPVQADPGWWAQTSRS